MFCCGSSLCAHRWSWSVRVIGVGGVFVSKRKTAYELRISDWGSDVCSSDLVAAGREASFRAGQYDGPAGLVGEGGAHRRDQRRLDLAGERVALLRVVDRQDRDGIAPLDLELVVAHRASLSGR